MFLLELGINICIYINYSIMLVPNLFQFVLIPSSLLRYNI